MGHYSFLRLWRYGNHLLILKLIVPRYRLNNFGRRCFAVAGPSTWNSLPNSLHDPALSLDMFRRQLKTLFCEILTRCTQRIRDFLIMRYINLHFTVHLLTYLLTWLLTYKTCWPIFGPHSLVSVLESRVSSPAAEQALEDASELVVKDGVDDRVEEAVDITQPGEQRKDDRIDSADGANVEQLVADTNSIADVDGKKRNPAEQKHTLQTLHIITLS